MTTAETRVKERRRRGVLRVQKGKSVEAREERYKAERSQGGKGRRVMKCAKKEREKKRRKGGGKEWRREVKYRCVKDNMNKVEQKREGNARRRKHYNEERIRSTKPKCVW